MKKPAKLSDASLKQRGIEILSDALGAARTIKFLSLMHQDSTDYVKISRLLYKEQSVDEIYERASKTWRKQPTPATTTA